MQDCHQFSTVKVKASLFLLLGLQVFVSPVLCCRPAAPLLKGQKLFEELSQSGRRVGLNVCSTENLKLQRWARELRTCGAAAVYLLVQMMDGRAAGCSVCAPPGELSLSRSSCTAACSPLIAPLKPDLAADLWLSATIPSVTPLTCMHTAPVCVCMFVSKSEGR